jgi:hypothetical protein
LTRGQGFPSDRIRINSSAVQRFSKSTNPHPDQSTIF